MNMGITLRAKGKSYCLPERKQTGQRKATKVENIQSSQQKEWKLNDTNTFQVPKESDLEPGILYPAQEFLRMRLNKSVFVFK